MMKQQHWVTMKAAAQKTDLHTSRVSRWAKRGLIASKSNPFDKRSRLVDLIELLEKLEMLEALQNTEDVE